MKSSVSMCVYGRRKGVCVGGVIFPMVPSKEGSGPSEAV